MVATPGFRWIDPATWPWIIYAWLILLVGGWLFTAWKWFQRRRATGWPVSDGRIESTDISKPRFSLTTQRGSFVARLGYSYSVAGTIYSGFYKREFSTELGAQDFLRELKGKAVAVRFCPSKPSRSMLLEVDIEAVLQNRPPSTDVEAGAASMIPEWIRSFIWVFVWLSAIGFLVALWVHLAALMGRDVPSAFWIFHVGIFVVWFPSVLVAQRLVGNTRRKDFWRVVLKGAPGWMRYMVYAIFGYSFLVSLISMGQVPNNGAAAQPGSTWRGFSAIWMAFYSAAFAILFSAAKTIEAAPRCVNGHLASANAHYCARCGQPVLRVR